MDDRLTERERREIAGRARTLHERLEGPSNSSGGEPPIDLDRILDEWRERFPDDRSFHERLARDGLTEDVVREEASAILWPADEPFPEWIDTLEAVIRHVESTATDDRGSVAVPAETPFAELIASIAGFARWRLSETPVPSDAISPTVEWLVNRLRKACTRPLYVEFKSYVEYHDPELSRADPDERTDPPTEYYEQFVDAMFDGGFTNLCLEYPVLARRLVRLLTQWVDAVEETCRRVQNDRAIVAERLGVEGGVTALEPLTDDTHARGRVPVRVSFESGEAIYKPRSVDAGVAFHELLDRLDEYLPTPSGRTPTFVPRDGYGWMEVVEYREPDDRGAVERYYERAGVVLCTAYVLNLTDLQLENVIVNGEHPMVVDAETLFHPYVDSTGTSIGTEIHELMNRSVLLPQLLPWSTGTPREPDEEVLATVLAGLGAESGRKRVSNQSRPVVEAANTDVMTVEKRPVGVTANTNTVTVDGEDQPPGEHVDAIVRGFEEAYETIRRLHADGRFLSEICTSELIEGVENRLVYRPTAAYRSVIRSSASRNSLRDGVRLSVEMEELAVPFFDGRIETDEYWPLYGAERKAIRRLDVPRFSSAPDEETLCHDGVSVGVEADGTGYERCRQRLDAMDPTDKRRQTWLIQQSLGTVEQPTTPPPAVETTDARLGRAAGDLFDDAIDAAFDTNDGSVWASISPATSTMTLVPADESLYDGRSGIALTAAALYDATGRERYRKLVGELLDPVIDDVDAGGSPFGLGGTKGVGSVIHVLSVIGSLLGEDAYRDSAVRAASSITEARLAEDDTLDVMWGAAGTLLGLLACYDRYGEETVLDRAIACGERLLEARVPVGDHRAWKTTREDTAITGFAHGSSGIAYALARLATAADDPRYAEAALEALDYESTLYAPSRTNWAKSPRRRRYQDMWCHGRTGMALARIGIGELFDDAQLLSDATEALSATAAAEPSTVDHVCCGNFGRAEALLVASRRASGDLADATELAGRCLARREDEGTLALPGHARSFANPTFFNGVSGVAYTLLRLRDPDSLPCALLLE